MILVIKSFFDTEKIFDTLNGKNFAKSMMPGGMRSQETGISYAKDYLQEVTSSLAFIPVNDHDEIVFCSNRGTDYVVAQHMMHTASILRAVEASLRPSLTVALAQSRHTESTVAFSHTVTSAKGNQADLLVTIRPLHAGTGNRIRMILFDRAEYAEATKFSVTTANQNLVSDLYAELMRSRGEFHRLTLDNEEAVNNLASLNEELYWINEELRTTSDELQLNRDTLKAGNALLSEMVSRISKANDDLENFVQATELALIFVDSDMRIIRFTAPAETVFRVRTGDVGRPLLDISHCMQYEHPEADIKSVLHTREKVEKEVKSTDGTWFCLRIIPYTNEGAEIIGAQHEWLRAAGCDYSQGFLYSLPLEIDALENLVRENFWQSSSLLKFSSAGR